MSYGDNSRPAPRRFATSPPISITVSQPPVPPSSSAAEKIHSLSAILTAHHGPEETTAFISFVANLHQAVKVVDAANEMVAREHEVSPPDPETGDVGVDVSPDCYARYEEKMRAAAELFLTAADAVGELADSKLCTPAILRGLPPRLLASIIRAGLEAEADELLNMLEAVNMPPAVDGEVDGQS